MDQAINGFVSLIEVPGTRTITLTSRSGEIPLTFRNETGYPVRLRAVLISDKLFFPKGSVLELELPPEELHVASRGRDPNLGYVPHQPGGDFD